VAERREVVIAGAGIGGLTAAIALAARGFPVIVCERAEQLSEIGAGIQLTPNAGRILDGLGLADAIAGPASEPAGLDIRAGASGDILASVRLDRMSERYGCPWRVIARADLQTALADAVADNPMIDLRLGTVVVDFEAGSREALIGVEAGSGRSVLSASALIAADGVQSELRGRLPGTAAARPIGRTAWRATVPAHIIEQVIHTSRISLWLGRQAHLVHYPIAGGRTVNLVAIVAEDWGGTGWSEPGDHSWLGERFGGWSAPVQDIVGAPAEWRKWAILAVDPTGSWVSGRVALLGDAVHAMPPYLAQGAAMAIEDAAVLAGSFAASPDEPESALRAYELVRRPRALRVSRAAFETGAYYHFGGLMEAARNAALRIAGPPLIMTRNRWIYGWRPAVS
jgi:2-polyprenyl-6-methoxyphenol hydroxylase-like FAD-dependent oxidoreductase